MRLKKIYLENIRSYEKQEINFPEGSVLLSGDIGSGKSTILLAVEFALFGLQRGKSGEGLLRNGKKEGRVKLEFEIDGKNIEIERRLKKSKESVNQEKCLLRLNGEETELTANELKSKVLGLLNYPLEFQTKNPVLFRYTVYTPQEEMKTILLEDSELRLNTLRRVFDIDKYKRVIENTEKIGSKLREEIKNREGMASDLNSKKDELAKKGDEIKKVKGEFAGLKMKHEEVEKIAKERKSKVNEIEEKTKELNRLKTDFARKESELSEKRIMLKRNRDEIESLKKQVNLLEGEVKGKSAEDVSKETNEKENNLKENEKKFIELNGKIVALESDKKRNFKLTEDVIKLINCPTCKQNVSDSHKKGIKEEAEKEIKKILVQLSEETKEKEEIFGIITQIKKELIILREKDKEASLIKLKLSNLKEKKAKEEFLADNIKKGEEKIREIDNLANELGKKMDSFKDIEKTYELAKRMLEEIMNEERQTAINRARAEKEIENIASIIENLNKEIAEKEKLREKMAYFKKLKDWLSENFIPMIAEIEKNVMAKVHYEFSQLFGKWFSILAEGLSARINEEFTPIIEQNGYEIDYDFLSGGERTAAALAYRLALNHVINSLMSNIKTRDLLILDEPTDGFSSEQLDKIRDVLNELKTEQLIIVSHEQKIESFVDKIIRLEKNEGTTRVN